MGEPELLVASRATATPPADPSHDPTDARVASAGDVDPRSGPEDTRATSGSRNASRGEEGAGYTDAQLSPRSEKGGYLSPTAPAPSTLAPPPPTASRSPQEDTVQPLPTMNKRERSARNRLSSIMTRSMPSLNRTTSPPAGKLATSPLSPPLSAPSHRAQPVPQPVRKAPALPAIWGSDNVEEEGSEYLDAMWGSSPPSSFGATSPTIASQMGVQRKPSAYGPAGAPSQPARPPALRTVSSSSALLTPQLSAPSSAALPSVAPSSTTSRPAPPPAIRTQSQPPSQAPQPARSKKPESPLPSPIASAAAKPKSKGTSSFKKFLKRAFSGSSPSSSGPSAAGNPSEPVAASRAAAKMVELVSPVSSVGLPSPSVAAVSPAPLPAAALASPPAVAAEAAQAALNAEAGAIIASDVTEPAQEEAGPFADPAKPERPTIVIPATPASASAPVQPVDPATIPLPKSPLVEEDLPAFPLVAPVPATAPAPMSTDPLPATTPVDDVDLSGAMLEEPPALPASTSLTSSDLSTLEDCASHPDDGEVDGGSIVRESSAGTASELALLTPADAVEAGGMPAAVVVPGEGDAQAEETPLAEDPGADAADVRKSRNTTPRPISRGREEQVPAFGPLVTHSVIEPPGSAALSAILAAEPVAVGLKRSAVSDLDLLSAGMQRSASVPVESVLETAPLSEERAMPGEIVSTLVAMSDSPAKTASTRSMSRSPTSSPSKSRFASALGLNRSATNSSTASASASPPKLGAGKRSSSVTGSPAGPPPPAASARYRVPTGPGLARSSSKLRRSVVGLADVLHPPPPEPAAPRPALSPTMHTLTSIHNQADAIVDKEEKELAESFFMY